MPITESVFEYISPKDVAARVVFFQSAPGGSKTIVNILPIPTGGFIFCFG
jgi:hypothetical protein